MTKQYDLATLKAALVAAAKVEADARKNTDEARHAYFKAHAMDLRIAKAKAMEAVQMPLPKVADPARVGTYSPLAGAGGGFVFDEVLEYRVWFKQNGESVYHAFATPEEAAEFSNQHDGAEPPLALVLQRQHVNEPEPGKRVLVRKRRVAEWQVIWLDDEHRRTPENVRRILGEVSPERAAG